MPGNDRKSRDLDNCIPYVELKTTEAETLKFLIDTGSNANYIRPSHARETAIKKGQERRVRTAAGDFKVNTFINFNPFPGLTEKRIFHLFDFHNYFDGLIGYEFLKKFKAVIDADKNILKIGNCEIPMKKYNQIKTLKAYEKNFFQVAANIENGEFLVNEDIEIGKGVVISSGLYNIENKKCF